MENFYKLISILALASTTLATQAETKFQGTFGFKSDHIRRAQVIGNDGAYYGNLNFSKAGLSFSATSLESMGGVDDEKKKTCHNIFLFVTRSSP